jgi:hypothetical protein
MHELMHSLPYSMLTTGALRPMMSSSYRRPSTSLSTHLNALALKPTQRRCRQWYVCQGRFGSNSQCTCTSTCRKGLQWERSRHAQLFVMYAIRLCRQGAYPSTLPASMAHPSTGGGYQGSFGGMPRHLLQGKHGGEEETAPMPAPSVPRSAKQLVHAAPVLPGLTPNTIL